MQDEVWQGMWAQLRAVQGTLPADPSSVNPAETFIYSVQSVTWYEAIFFANLLSLQQGFPRCYYTDAGFSTPLDSTNYADGNVSCNFAAMGYRLPTEGEWEYMCRAGTTSTFAVDETNYTDENCDNCLPGLLAGLESIAWFCMGGNGTPSGFKAANPWHLQDMHDNVDEWCWDRFGEYPSQATDFTGRTDQA